MPDSIEPSTIDWERADHLAEWENRACGMIREALIEDFPDNNTPNVKLAYMGAGRFQDVAPDLLKDDADEETKNLQVTVWRLRYPDPESVKIAPTRDGLHSDEAVTLTGKVEMHRNHMYVRPGYPTRVMLAVGVLWCKGFVVGHSQIPDATRDELRRQFVELLTDMVENVPPTLRAAPREEPDNDHDIREQVTAILQDVRSEMRGGAVSVNTPPVTVDVEDDAPAPRPQTEEYDPSPFQGEPPMASLLADTFSGKATRALMEADGEPAPTYKGEWGRDSTGHPIRVEQLGNPYEGRATFRVQAYGEPDPAALEASMGWKMLEGMNMDTVWLNLLLLSYASATHRRGERPIIKIERRVVERVFGFRHRNKSVKERAEAIKPHVKALQSILVELQNVRRHGSKLRFRGDMGQGAPLWNLRMVAEGEADLFTGETVADWHLEAREGLWATEFLHNHGDQWTPLPKEWFEKIDRRGSKNYAQRLAVYLLLQFRVNAKNANRVTRTAQNLLKVCGEDMTKARDTRRRTELKRCLSKALDTLERDYNIRVHAEDVHIDSTKWISFSDWKARTVAFDPPASMDGRLFANAESEPPPLPEVTGDWSSGQIKRLRTEIMDETGAKFGERLGVSKQYVSQLERGTSDPSNRVRKILDKLHARYS